MTVEWQTAATSGICSINIWGQIRTKRERVASVQTHKRALEALKPNFIAAITEITKKKRNEREAFCGAAAVIATGSDDGKQLIGRAEVVSSASARKRQCSQASRWETKFNPGGSADGAKFSRGGDISCSLQLDASEPEDKFKPCGVYYSSTLQQPDSFCLFLGLFPCFFWGGRSCCINKYTFLANQLLRWQTWKSGTNQLFDAFQFWNLYFSVLDSSTVAWNS